MNQIQKINPEYYKKNSQNWTMVVAKDGSTPLHSLCHLMFEEEREGLRGVFEEEFWRCVDFGVDVCAKGSFYYYYYSYLQFLFAIMIIIMIIMIITIIIIIIILILLLSLLHFPPSILLIPLSLPDKNGNTILHLLTQKIHHEYGHDRGDDVARIIQQLLELGGDVHAKNNRGLTPLFVVLSKRLWNDDVVGVLIAGGSDVRFFILFFFFFFFFFFLFLLVWLFTNLYSFLIFIYVFMYLCIYVFMYLCISAFMYVFLIHHLFSQRNLSSYLLCFIQ